MSGKKIAVKTYLFQMKMYGFTINQVVINIGFHYFEFFIYIQDQTFYSMTLESHDLVYALLKCKGSKMYLPVLPAVSVSKEPYFRICLESGPETVIYQALLFIRPLIFNF